MLTRLSQELMRERKPESRQIWKRSILSSSADTATLLPSKDQIFKQAYQLHSIMESLIDRLDTFPNWMEYVAGKHDPLEYNYDGRHASQRKVPALPPTYLAWLEDKMTSKRRLERGAIINVLGEAFPQQLQGATISNVLPPGERAVSRTWRLRRVARPGR